MVVSKNVASAGVPTAFVYWYLICFAGESPFSFSALDIKSYAMAVLGTEYCETVKRNMPTEWFDKLPHTHKARGGQRHAPNKRLGSSQTRGSKSATIVEFSAVPPCHCQSVPAVSMKNQLPFWSWSHFSL